MMQSEEEPSQGFQSALSEFPNYPESDPDFTQLSSHAGDWLRDGSDVWSRGSKSSRQYDDDIVWSKIELSENEHDRSGLSENGDGNTSGIGRHDEDSNRPCTSCRVQADGKAPSTPEDGPSIVNDKSNPSTSFNTHDVSYFCQCCKEKITREFTTQTDFTLQRKLELQSEKYVPQRKCKMFFRTIKRKLYPRSKKKQKVAQPEKEKCPNYYLRSKSYCTKGQKMTRVDHSYDDLVSMGLVKAPQPLKTPELNTYEENKNSSKASDSPDASKRSIKKESSSMDYKGKSRIHYTEVKHTPQQPPTEYMNVDKYDEEEPDYNPNGLKTTCRKNRSIFANYVKKGDDSFDETSTFGVDFWSDCETLTRDEPPPPVPPRCKPKRHQSFLNDVISSKIVGVKQHRSSSLPTPSLGITSSSTTTPRRFIDDSHQYVNLNAYRAKRTTNYSPDDVKKESSKLHRSSSNVTISISQRTVPRPSIVIRRDSKILSKLRKLPFRQSSYVETNANVYNNIRPKPKSGIVNTDL